MANEQNLIPAKKGEVRNPKGKPKGTKSLSTVIRELEGEVDWKDFPIVGNDTLVEKYKNKSAWKAIVYVAVAQAMSGNIQAMEWLRKAGYGDKHEVNIRVSPIREILVGAGFLEGDDDRQNDQVAQEPSDNQTQS